MRMVEYALTSRMNNTPAVTSVREIKFGLFQDPVNIVDVDSYIVYATTLAWEGKDTPAFFMVLSEACWTSPCPRQQFSLKTLLTQDLILSNQHLTVTFCVRQPGVTMGRGGKSQSLTFNLELAKEVFCNYSIRIQRFFDGGETFSTLS
jgi:hypothetical protein